MSRQKIAFKEVKGLRLVITFVHVGVFVDEICHRAVTCEVAHLGTNCTHHTYILFIEQQRHSSKHIEFQCVCQIAFAVHYQQIAKASWVFLQTMLEKNLTSKRLAN